MTMDKRSLLESQTKIAPLPPLEWLQLRRPWVPDLETRPQEAVLSTLECDFYYTFGYYNASAQKTTGVYNGTDCIRNLTRHTL
jgi:hypothetical protein